MGKVRFNEDREVVERVKERKPEFKCVCEEFKAQIQDPDFEGYCHCRLYYKEK